MDFKNSEIKTFLPLLYSLQRCGSHCERNDDPTFSFLCKATRQAVFNPKVLNLSDNKREQLKQLLSKDKTKIKYLTNSKGNIKRKRKVVRQSGEGLGTLIAIIAPILIDQIVRAINRKKK